MLSVGSDVRMYISVLLTKFLQTSGGKISRISKRRWLFESWARGKEIELWDKEREIFIWDNVPSGPKGYICGKPGQGSCHIILTLYTLLPKLQTNSYLTEYRRLFLQWLSYQAKAHHAVWLQFLTIWTRADCVITISEVSLFSVMTH